jgi:FdhE protein
MQRILDPARIEDFGRQRSIPRLRLADPAELFLKRAARLRRLSENHSIGPYLGLMAAVCEAQHAALGMLTALPGEPAAAESARRSIALSREHGMPLVPASSWPRDGRWRTVLEHLCDGLAARADLTPAVRAHCGRLREREAALLEDQAQRLVTCAADIDTEVAPFIMAALQVYWVHLLASVAEPEARRLATAPIRADKADAPGVCPLCGVLPVASVVRAESPYEGYRYLHCGLCATEWHLVRIKCSHCLSTEGIGYHHVAGGAEAVRAESCESCRMYRKILYQEKDATVEPLADDLASLALDLLMAAEGYQRACCNPLLWQGAER